MALVNLVGAVVPRGIDTNGDASSGALLYVYQAGTATAVTTYSDIAGTTPNASPVVADSSGAWGDIYVNAGTYKIDIQDSGGTSLPGYPIDDVAIAAETTSNFDTRAAVAAATIATNIEYVRTAGYTTVGDGGGALYDRVASEPGHAYKVQSADGAWWEGVPDPGGLNVKAVGATGDGTTDDSTAIQNALDYASLTTRGGTVVFPFTAGEVYSVSTTLEIDFVQGVNTTKKIRLQGTGAPWPPTEGGVEQSRIQWNGTDGGGPIFKLTNPINVVVEHINFDGNSLSNICVEQVGETGGWGNVNWNQCGFERSKHACVKYSGAVDGGRNKFVNCVFTKRTTVTGTANQDCLVEYAGVNNVNDEFINCDMTYTFSGAPEAGSSVIYRSTGAMQVHVSGGFMKAGTIFVDSAGTGTLNLTVTSLYAETGDSGTFYKASNVKSNTHVNFMHVRSPGGTSAGKFIDIDGQGQGIGLLVVGGYSKAVTTLTTTADEFPVTFIGFDDYGGAYTTPGSLSPFSNVNHISCSHASTTRVYGADYMVKRGLRPRDEETDTVLNVSPTYHSSHRVAVSAGTVTIGDPTTNLTEFDDGFEFVIELRNTSTGSPTTSWNAVWTVAGGTAPDFPSGAAGTTVATFRYRHDIGDLLEISRVTDAS